MRLWSPDGKAGSSLEGHSGSVKAVAWSPDAKRLLSGGSDGTVGLWTAEGRPEATLRGSPQSIDTVSWSPDGKSIAAGGNNGIVHVWDAATGQPRWTIVLLRGDRAVSLDAAGKYLHGDAGALEGDLVFVVEEPSGRLVTLAPAEFYQRFNPQPRAAGSRPTPEDLRPGPTPR